MYCLLFLASLVVGGVYHPEDYYYYDENLSPHGANPSNSIYVEVTAENRKQFIKFTEKLKDLESFRDIKTDRLNGILLFFKTKDATMKALNSCRNYNAFPVVLYEHIECAAVNEIWIKLKSGVNSTDFINRLEAVADGEFQLTEFKNIHLLRFKNLVNPSNNLILANLIAKDSFWVDHAMIAWAPLDGPIRAYASVETMANADLGETRRYKLEIDVFDPEIKVRTDLLPQLGQGLVPFPNSGELWFDVLDMEVSELQLGKVKRTTINIPFRQLQYGNFVFQPILVSYEKNKQLKTVKTNLCPYSVRSIIADTNLNDIQDRCSSPNLSVLVPQKPEVDASKIKLYGSIRHIVASVFLAIFNLFLLSFIIDIYNYVKVSGDDGKDVLWNDLRNARKIIRANWRAEYTNISSKLNKVLTETFGVSLYSINLDECNSNFKAIVAELNKSYTAGEDVVVESDLLADNLEVFCKRKTYKKEL